MCAVLYKIDYCLKIFWQLWTLILLLKACKYQHRSLKHGTHSFVSFWSCTDDTCHQQNLRVILVSNSVRKPKQNFSNFSTNIAKKNIAIFSNFSYFSAASAVKTKTFLQSMPQRAVRCKFDTLWKTPIRCQLESIWNVHRKTRGKLTDSQLKLMCEQWEPVER